MMKKILLACISILAIACTTDRNQEANSQDTINNTDPNASEEKVSIHGTWKLDSSNKISGNDQKTVISTEIPGACAQFSRYVFQEGNIYLSNGYYLEAKDECVLRAYKTAFTYNKDSKTLQIDGMLAKVTELSKNKLILLDQMNADYNGDGVDDYIQFNYSR